MTEAVRETPNPSAAAGHCIFSTTDPEEAHAYVCRTYVETSIQPIGDQAHLRMRDERHDLGPFSIENFTHTAGLKNWFRR